MNGTLALWYESKSGPDERDKESRLEKAPLVRLHINLWRDFGKKFNFLDVGFLLEETNDLDLLYLYLPAPIDMASIFDLSGALKDADTLNAVFNEVAFIERDADEHFFVSTDSGRRIIHHLEPRRDLIVQRVTVPGRNGGTIIALKSAFCARIDKMATAAPQHYVRIRILLDGEAQSLFTSEDAATSVGLSLTQDILETTEFRLNERRSYPHVILQRSTKGQVRLKSVHYFLIRSKNHQLGSQHQNFRKVRYLEPDIWKSYLSVGQPPPNRWSKSASADGMIIYQWRELAKEDRKSLDDFIAYASFRVVHDKIPAYFVAILAIGGVGGAVLNIGVAGMRKMFILSGWDKPSDGWANLWVGASLGLLALLPMAHAKFKRWRRGK